VCDDLGRITNRRVAMKSRSKPGAVLKPAEEITATEITLEFCQQNLRRIEKRFSELQQEIQRSREEWHYWQAKAEEHGEVHDRYH